MKKKAATLPKPKVGAPFGNQNNAKDDSLDDQTTFRHLRSERDAWMAARIKDEHGQPEKLVTWMRRSLNAAARL